MAWIDRGRVDLTKQNSVMQVSALCGALILTATASFSTASAQSVDLRTEAQIRRDAALDTYGEYLAFNDIAPRAGATETDAVIVEFFDYACGYCRYNHPKLTSILESEPTARVVYQPYPILDARTGPKLSTMAAKVGIAVQAKGDFATYHARMMERRVQLSEALIDAAAKDAGLSETDIAAAKTDAAAQSYLDEVSIIASTLGVRGTPAYVIGGRVYRGAIDADVMRHAAGLPPEAVTDTAE